MGIDSQECPSCEGKFIVIQIKWVENSYMSYHGTEKPYFVMAKCCPFCGTQVVIDEDVDNGD